MTIYTLSSGPEISGVAVVRVFGKDKKIMLSSFNSIKNLHKL